MDSNKYMRKMDILTRPLKDLRTSHYDTLDYVGCQDPKWEPRKRLSSYQNHDLPGSVVSKRDGRFPE